MRPKQITPRMLKQLRRDAGLTLSEMGYIFGVAGNTIWRWESGRSPINQYKVSFYAPYLNGLIREKAKENGAA